MRISEGRLTGSDETRGNNKESEKDEGKIENEARYMRTEGRESVRKK